MVTMDLRGHGWTSAKVEDTYGRELAARDVLNLMVSVLFFFLSESSLIGSCFQGHPKHSRRPRHGRLDGRQCRAPDGRRSSRESAVALHALTSATKGGTLAMFIIPNVC